MGIEQTHVVQELRPGGIESLAVNLTRLAGPGCELVSLNGTVRQLLAGWDVLSPVAGQLTAFSKAGGVRPGLIHSLARHFRRTRTRSVITHHVGPLLYAGIAARLAGVPVVAHVEHDAWHYDDPKRRRLGRALMGLVKPRLAAVSRAVAEGVEQSIGATATVIPNGTDIEIFRPSSKQEARRRLGLCEKVRLIGCAGRLEEVKGFDLLIEAMTKLPSDVQVVIFGVGSQAHALEQQALRLGVADRVTLAGLSNDMKRVYPAFDIFCLPSRFEGLPLAALEAQACGIPTVGFDVGGVAEALCPDSSCLVPCEDVEALALALAATLDTPAESSPRDFVIDHYSIEQTLRAYADFTRV